MVSFCDQIYYCGPLYIAVSLMRSGAQHEIESARVGYFSVLEVVCCMVVADARPGHCVFCCFRYNDDSEVVIVIIRV